MNNDKINGEYSPDEELKKNFAAFKKRLGGIGNRSLLYDFGLLEDRTSTSMSEKDKLIESDVLIPTIKNRRGIEAALKLEIARANRENHGVRKGEPLRYLFSLVEVDFDVFKPVNDTYGHLVGDDFLRLFASSFEQIKPRIEDTIGRYGGDEFVLILPHPHPKEISPEYVTSRIVTPLRDRFYENSKARLSELEKQTKKPLIANERKIEGIGLSIGMTNYPLLSESPLDIISDADTAMYQAKALKDSPSDEKGNYKGHIVIFEKPKII